MKRLLACLVMLFVSLGLAQSSFTIIHFNDVYEIEPVRGDLGGAARVATLINEEAADPLVLFSGDLFSPSVMSSIFQGAQMVDVFNQLGVDYAVFGNHEFDFGKDVTLERVAESDFPWLSTNLFDKATGEPFADGVVDVMTEINGVKVGIIGLIEDWRNLTSAGNSADYFDFVTIGQATAQNLKAQGADMVIALTHMEMRNDRLLAEQVPEIDLILGGHDHAPMHEVVNGTLIWKTGSDFRTLGKLKVIPVHGQKAIFLPEYINVNSSIASDPLMQEVVDGYAAAKNVELDVPIGETITALDAQRATVRTQESNMGNLIADAMRSFTGADVAFANGGGIRTDSMYGPGPLTRGDIFSVLPFGNVVITIELSGADLLAALENGVSSVENVSGRFAQLSGAQISYDPSAEAGSRLTGVSVNGAAVDPAATYVVAVNDFIGRGGDGYASFENAPRILTEAGGPLLAEVVIDYVRANSPIAYETEGRISTP